MVLDINSLSSAQRARLKQLPQNQRGVFLDKYLRTYNQYGFDSQDDLAAMKASDPAKYAQFRNQIVTINNNAGGRIAAAKPDSGFFSGGLGGILKSLAPIGLSFALPGIGSALGISSTLGKTALGGLMGAGVGGLTGGSLKSALLGGVTGAAGGYLSSGGSIPGLGNFASNVPKSGVGPTQIPGSGILGSVGKSVGGLSNILKGGSSSGGGLSLGNIGTIASGINSYNTQDDLEKQLLAAQGKAANVIAPYNRTGQQANQMLFDELQSGALGQPFNPGDLTQTPGYQFQLAEGQKALDRQLAASGMSQSGAAMKAAQEYGQNLASTTYDDAYERYMQEQAQRYNMLAGQSSQGYQAAGGMADIYTNQGNIGANADAARSNILTGTLSSVLSGNGAMKIVGYKPDGTPIYYQTGTA